MLSRVGRDVVFHFAGESEWIQSLIKGQFTIGKRLFLAILEDSSTKELRPTYSTEILVRAKKIIERRNSRLQAMGKVTWTEVEERTIVEKWEQPAVEFGAIESFSDTAPPVFGTP